jgi:hypothetical protein
MDHAPRWIPNWNPARSAMHMESSLTESWNLVRQSSYTEGFLLIVAIIATTNNNVNYQSINRFVLVSLFCNI